jgi:glycosyltransferase A (GT-A) superfamily protein (DUF2064 family)
VTVLVLAKAPVAGRVKTRLCPPCTPEEAADIAAAALADTIDVAVRTDAVVLAVDGALPCPAGPVIIPQRGAGLGARIAAAFADVGVGPILLIGMDTPQVTPVLLGSCLSALDGSVDAVLGPATDGGWWALGLHDPLHAQLLEDVPMSTPSTGHDTLAALRGAGLRVGPLPTLRDVDRWTDAIAVAGLAPWGRFAATVRRLGAVLPA